MSDFSSVGLYFAELIATWIGGISVLVAGAGLAGLTAARELRTKGARVAIVDVRDRVGGRVLTGTRSLPPRRAAEVGADLIDESQTEICKLIAAVGLRTANILPGGFTSVCQVRGRRRIVAESRGGTWRNAPQPEVLGVPPQRAAMGWRKRGSLARESVAHWLDCIRAPQGLRGIAVGLRGFFLPDPDKLSLLALTDQFADEGAPGGEQMFRIIGGNDRLPAILAKALGSRLQLRTILRRVTQTRNGVTAALESNGRVNEARFDYLVCGAADDDVARYPVRSESSRDSAAGSDSSQVWSRDENRSAIRSRFMAQAGHAPRIRDPVFHRRGLGRQRGAARIHLDADRRRRRKRRHARDASTPKAPRAWRASCPGST